MVRTCVGNQAYEKVLFVSTNIVVAAVAAAAAGDAVSAAAD